MMHLGFLSIDIIVLIALFAILFFATLRTEKKLIISLIVATYPTLLVFRNFPYVKLEAGLPQAVWFLALYAVIVGILWGHIHTRRVFTSFRKFFDYGVLIVAFIALLISVSTHFVPSLQSIYTFSGTFSRFVEGINPGLMLILPIVAILITNKNDA
jgi:hypothetical protein